VQRRSYSMRETWNCPECNPGEADTERALARCQGAVVVEEGIARG
jgi:hypothetical protein